MSTETAERPEIADEVVAPAGTTSAVAEYNATAAALVDLESRLKDKAYEVNDKGMMTTAGDKAARADRLELTKLISALEAKRVELKAPVLASGRLIDGEAERITLLLEALRKPIALKIKADEELREADRVARIEAERVRVAALRQRIDDIAAVARRAVGKPAAEIEAKIQLLVAQEIGPDFGDFLLEAERVHAEALGQLRELLEAAQAQEAEAARLAAERAALIRADKFARQLDAMRSMPSMLVGKKAETIRVALNAQESGPLVGWDEFEPQAIEVRDAAVATMRTMLAAAEAAEQVAAEQAAEAKRLADARTAQARADAEAAEARRAADAQAAAERAEQDRLAREAREAEQRRQDEAAAELRQREIDLAERIAAENRVLPEPEPGPVCDPVQFEASSNVEPAMSQFASRPDFEAAFTAANAEPAGPVATMKLGAINDAFGGFLRVDAAGLERLGFARQQRSGPGVHFLASDFPAVCDALMVKIVAAKAAAVVA